MTGLPILSFKYLAQNTYMRYFILTLFIVICFSHKTSAQFDDKFYFPKKKWNNIDTVKYEDVTFRMDTATLSGIILNPVKVHPLATIIYFHGAGGNVTTYVPIAKPLADAGFRVFMIDMQGYGKSTGKPTHLNIAHDAQVIFDNIMQRKDISSTKVIVMGVSMGTQIATKIAKDNQDRIAALILEGTISSFTDIAADTSPKEQQQMVRNFLKSPYAAKEDIKGITFVPKLFVHSTEDSTVPFKEGKLVFDNAANPKELWEVKGEHLDAINLYRDEYIRKLVSLLK
jgi:pimeloyl-ACP methyl ester carboxylesterase